MEPNLSGSFLFNNGLNQFPTDIKAPVCQYSVPNSFYKLGPGNLNAQLQAGTPHGISDILSRSVVGAPANTTLLSGYSSMGGFSGTMSTPGVYYNRDYTPTTLGAFPKPTECPGMKGRTSCWVEGGYDWRGGRQQGSNSKKTQSFIFLRNPISKIYSCLLLLYLNNTWYDISRNHYKQILLIRFSWYV